MTATSELDLKEAAEEAAGNWRSFECFAWFRRGEIDDSDQWAIFYTQHRDSGLLDQSNAAVIEKALEPFTEGDDPDVVFESHTHWAVGHVDGFSIRIFRKGEVTEAFQQYHELACRLEAYPILDDEDYSLREFEATLENLGLAAWRLKDEFDLPEGWEGEAYEWLSNHSPKAVENRDDQGGYPEEDELAAAFAALEYRRVD